MTATPRGFRLHIGIFGRRNAGKSALLNRLAGLEASIVSPVPGSTADPVERPMEFIPLGPVLWIDTAGVDDGGALGEKRLARTRSVAGRADLALILFHGEWGGCERELHDEFRRRGVPVVAVAGKSDLGPSSAAGLPEGLVPVAVSAETGAGIEDLRRAMLAAVPADFIEARPIAADLLPPDGTAVLVIPLDGEAPKGRLILPQAQTIRDLLDAGRRALATRPDGLAAALAGLREKPGLVVTDSQAFRRVAEIVPPDVPLTAFSILFARARGDLAVFAGGAAAIGRLRAGARVLVAESCVHHSGGDDIGRVKLPNLLRERTGVDLAFEHRAGDDFPADLSPYALVLHCGACMANRRSVLSRAMAARAAGVPITNYGVAIAWCLGLLERALAPFPGALAACRAAEAPE